METNNGTGRKSIGNEGITIEGLAEGGSMGKSPRHKMLRQNGECYNVGVLRCTHPDGTYVDNDGENS